MRPRVQVFLSAAFLTSLGVTVSLSHGSIVVLYTDESGLDCICDESSCARGGTRSISRGNFLHRSDLWSAFHCVQGIDRRAWMPSRGILCQHVASLPEAGRTSHGHKCQSRVRRRDLRHILRFVIQSSHASLWVDSVSCCFGRYGCCAGNRLL
jgi:hypothetical protein